MNLNYHIKYCDITSQLSGSFNQMYFGWTFDFEFRRQIDRVYFDYRLRDTVGLRQADESVAGVYSIEFTYRIISVVSEIE